MCVLLAGGSRLDVFWVSGSGVQGLPEKSSGQILEQFLIIVVTKACKHIRLGHKHSDLYVITLLLGSAHRGIGAGRQDKA